jgi:hypothetical protein
MLFICPFCQPLDHNTDSQVIIFRCLSHCNFNLRLKMSKELMPQVETSKRNPYLPKEVRAIIYAYLGGPSNVIRFELYVHSRDPADSRCFKIDNHLTSSCDIHVPSVAFGIESWSRISALENNIQLHPRTKFQPRPVYFRPKLDVIQIPAMMFYDGRSFNDHWDRVYGNWGWHFAVIGVGTLR